MQHVFSRRFYLLRDQNYDTLPSQTRQTNPSYTNRHCKQPFQTTSALSLRQFQRIYLPSSMYISPAHHSPNQSLFVIATVQFPPRQSQRLPHGSRPMRTSPLSTTTELLILHCIGCDLNIKHPPTLLHIQHASPGLVPEHASHFAYPPVRYLRVGSCPSRQNGAKILSRSRSARYLYTTGATRMIVLLPDTETRSRHRLYDFRPVTTILNPVNTLPTAFKIYHMHLTLTI